MTEKKSKGRRYGTAIGVLVVLAIVVVVLAKLDYWNPPPKPFDTLLAKWGLWTPPPTLAEKMKQREEETKRLAEAALAALNEAGARTNLNTRYNAWEVSFPDGQVSDDQLNELQKVSRVYNLDLSNSSIADDQLMLVNNMTSLVYLNLSGTTVSNAGLEKLNALPYLTFLNLAGTKVSAEGIRGFEERRKNNATIASQREEFSKSYQKLPPIEITFDGALQNEQ